jgi:hypothetical protein
VNVREGGSKENIRIKGSEWKGITGEKRKKKE